MQFASIFNVFTSIELREVSIRTHHVRFADALHEQLAFAVLAYTGHCHVWQGKLHHGLVTPGSPPKHTGSGKNRCMLAF
eukprot:scaffold253239_cov18-Prasinocladus_malaysianus.AAC.1